MSKRVIRAPRGPERSCQGWVQEAALRMLMNNLDPEVAEDPDRLVVYGGSGKAARTWADFDRIVATLRKLGNDETLLVQSGKPVGVIRTHTMAPRVLIANSLLVPKWATWEEFRKLEAMGLTMFGQMTAGSWIYIGTQGILQGTYETFVACGRKHFGALPARSASEGEPAPGRPSLEGPLSGRLVLTAGLGVCNGDSGGPVFDARDHALIGIVSWTARADGEPACGFVSGVIPLARYRYWILETAARLGSPLEP